MYADSLPALGHFDVRQNDSAGLLDLDEQEYFSDGLAKYYQHILNLFEKVKARSYVADFARMALQSVNLGREDVCLCPFLQQARANHTQTSDQKTELLSRLFGANIQTSHFEEAYATLTRHTNPILLACPTTLSLKFKMTDALPSRKANLTTLITTLSLPTHSSLLLTLPFTTLATDVDAILASLAEKQQNVLKGPAYHNLLAAFRIQRHDFRGAASVLHERLERLRWGSSSSSVLDPGNDSLQKNLLALANMLACVEGDQAWILAEQTEGEREWRAEEGRKRAKKEKGKEKVDTGPRRKVVGLEDVRREYQQELDRVAMIGAGRFAFGGGEEMDVL